MVDLRLIARYEHNITIADIRKAKPKMIFYSVHTPWWTHDPKDLGTMLGTQGLPCDPYGSVLFQTEDIDGFFKAAEEKSEHYGKHGLRALEAAHHQNGLVSFKHPTWQDYNDLIDLAEHEVIDGTEETP